MAWKETVAADRRIGFIGGHLSGEWTMTELCERFGISRKSGCKWAARYAAEGAAGLADRPRAALAHGRATPPHLAEAIEALRRERPSWGPRKIVARLAARERAPLTPAPRMTSGSACKQRGGIEGG